MPTNLFKTHESPSVVAGVRSGGLPQRDSLKLGRAPTRTTATTLGDSSTPTRPKTVADAPSYLGFGDRLEARSGEHLPVSLDGESVTR